MNSGNIVSAVFGTILKVFFTIAVIFVIYQGAAKCYDYGYRIFTEPAVSGGEGRLVTVAVTKDMSPTQIGETFAQKGLVKDSKLFALQYIFSEYYKDVKPGVYELSTAMTVEEMMQVMASGEETAEPLPSGETAISEKKDETGTTGESDMPGETGTPEE